MLLGLCGKPHSGKSEVRFILENLGFQTVNTKIPIAKACHALTNLPLEDFLTQRGKSKLYNGVPLRNIMGQVQNSIENLFGDYHTVEAALAPYLINKTDKLIVDSLRKTQTLYFPGKVVEVVSVRSIDSLNEFDNYDRSRIDAIIENNGSLGELETNVIRVLEDLGLRL